MKWERYVAHIEKMRNPYKTLVGKSDRKRPLGRLRQTGRIILKWVLKGDGMCMYGLDSSGSK
jgi:hypothetical protein